MTPTNTKAAAEMVVDQIALLLRRGQFLAAKDVAVSYGIEEWFQSFWLPEEDTTTFEDLFGHK